MATVEIDHLEPVRPMRAGEIPVIDFAPFLSGDAAARLAVAQEIGQACETVGFFYLAGHGVPASLLDAIFAQSRRFYAQTPQQKARTAATWEWYRGWVPPRPVGESGRRGGFSESFRLMADLPPDDPDVRAGKPLHLPNRYPDDMPEFRDVARAYWAALMRLSHHLLHAFALALQLPEDWFDDKFRKPLSQLNLLYYPPLPPDAQPDDMSSYPHTDEGMFTLLVQDDVGGLEVRSRQREWMQAPAIPGTFVVNIGDQMMRWSGDRFLSNAHRVRNYSGRERYSIPFFMNADYDVVLTSMPNAPKSYPALHVGPHMEKFWGAGMAFLKPTG